MQPAITFERLQIEGWRQFDNVNIDIHPRLTVITGANGSGKTTLLSIFSNHFGWNRQYLSTPSRSKTGGYSYGAGLFKSLMARISRPRANLSHVGYLKYSNGVETVLAINNAAVAQYNLEMPNRQNAEGLHVDSYRPTPRYQPVPSIQMGNIDALSAYHQYHNELISFFGGGYTNSSPMFRMKEALMTMAIMGEGNIHVPGNPTLKSIFIGFNEILKKVLPDSIGFQEISIRNPDVVLVTKSGNFMIDASSGGLMALVDLAWRIFMFSRDKPSFTVTMDEPENHLHPSMQRSLMQRLMTAFPQARFIVATHSPFIVSAVKDSYVYVLRYTPDQLLPDSQDESEKFGRKVFSERLDTINKAGSAGDILREVLGVEVTLPEWVEIDIQSIVNRYKGQEVTVQVLNNLRADLSEVGFGEYYPSALASLTR